MFIKLVPYLRYTVHEGLGLIFLVLAYSVAHKATHSMFVSDIGSLYSVHVFPMLRGGEKKLKIANCIKGETKPGRIVV